MTEKSAYTNFANAIVLQAVEDFKYAVLEDNRGRQIEIRKFFKSPWCDFLTKMDCTHLADRLKEDTIEFMRLTSVNLNHSRCKGMNKDKWNAMPDEEKEQFKDVFRCPTCGGAVNQYYGFMAREKRHGDWHNIYGWNTKCTNCLFRIKNEREAILCEKKEKTNETNQPD